MHRDRLSTQSVFLPRNTSFAGVGIIWYPFTGIPHRKWGVGIFSRACLITNGLENSLQMLSFHRHTTRDLVYTYGSNVGYTKLWSWILQWTKGD